MSTKFNDVNDFLRVITPDPLDNKIQELIYFIKSQKIKFSNQINDFQNIIKLQGNVWTITYNGKKKIIKDSYGMRIIVHLMKNPGEQLRSDNIYHYVFGSTQPNVSKYIDDNLSKKNIVHPDEYHTVDMKTIKQVIDSKKMFEIQLKEIELTNDIALINELESKIKKINSYLNTVTDKYGNPRKISDSIEKSRKALWKNVNTSLKHIKELHPNFYNHLKECLVYQKYSSYRSYPPIHWTFQL